MEVHVVVRVWMSKVCRPPVMGEGDGGVGACGLANQSDNLPWRQDGVWESETTMVAFSMFCH